MKITESDIHLKSHHDYRQRVEVMASQQLSFRQALAVQSPSSESDERKRLAQTLQRLLEAILAALEGRKCRPDLNDCRLPPQAEQPVRELEWRVDFHETVEETERTGVAATGVIRTADGKEIDFALHLQMRRHYQSEVDGSMTGKAKLRDPLVINFDGKAAELTSDRIDFDLDSDGVAEKIPGLGGGSGYLVLDRNGNGRADNGKELFGAVSGDGFAELAKLDDDHNGWIDESDAAYSELRLWKGQGSGADQWRTLAQAGVGAVWLGSVDSPFSLRDGTNGLLGEIRATGLWLSDEGRVGTVQQVDLAASPAGQSGTGSSEVL